MATVTSSVFDDDFKAYMTYSTSSTNTTYSVTVTSAGVYIACSWASYPWKTTLSATSYDTRTGTLGSATRNQGYHGVITTDKTYSWTRKTSAYSVTIKVTTKKNTSDTSTGTKSVTFTVPALASYKVSYNANGGSGAPSAQTKYYGKTLTLSSTKPTRTGYTFEGWGTSTTDTTPAKQPGDSYTSNASETYYAIWKKTITLSYNANGGSGAPASSSSTIYNATTSKTFTISSTKPTKSGYTFVGWSKTSTATSASYSSGGSITLSSSDTLYAIWKKTITLSYNVNGGSGGIASQSATVYNATTSYTFTLSSTKPTRTNYVFLGWATSSTATAPSSSISNGKITVSSSTTLYAVWKLNYVAPNIKVSAKRVDDSGNDADEGVKGRATVVWTAGTLGGAVQASTITIQCSISGNNSWTTVHTANITAASGTTTTAVFDLPVMSGTTSAETQYDIKATISDSSGSASASTFISKAQFVIDINEDGTGVSFGSACSKPGLSSSWNIYLDKGKYIHGVLGADGLDHRLVGTSSSVDSDIHFCYTSYEKSVGTVYYSGNKVYIRSREDIDINNRINVNGSVCIPNTSYIGCKNTAGNYRNSLCISSSDNLLVGYGQYNSSEGSTYVYGYNGLYLRSSTKIYPNTTIEFPNTYGIRGKTTGDTSLTLAYVSSSNNIIYGDSSNASYVYLQNKHFQLRLNPPDSGSSINGYFYPVADALVSCGTSSHKWYRLYAGSATVLTSDRRQKENIKPLGSVSKTINSSSATYSMNPRSRSVETERTDIYSELFDRLEPVEYNLINSGNRRKNFGLIAQDILAVMEELGIDEDELDLVYHEYHKDEETGEEFDTYGLAYENLIALLIHEVQKLKGVNNEG